MNKILLELFIPATGKIIEIRVPRNLKVATARDMIIGYLKSLSELEYVPSDRSVLCDYETGAIFEANLFINQLGLMNGSKIMII